MSPIWCSSLLIDGPLLGFCVWSNILSLLRPSGNRIQTNKKSLWSLGLSPKMKKKMVSAEMVCICDPNWIFFNKFRKLKWKHRTKNLSSRLLAFEYSLSFCKLDFMLNLRCFGEQWGFFMKAKGKLWSFYTFFSCCLSHRGVLMNKLTGQP